MDYRASAETIVGFALAGGGTDWKVAQGLGTGRSDAFMVGAGTSYWGPALSRRRGAFANYWLTLGDQIAANLIGQDFAGRVEAGYCYAVPARSLSASGGGLGWGGVLRRAADP